MAELSALNIKITGDATDLKAAVGSATTELGKITTAADRANAGSARLATGLGNTGAAAAGSSHMLRGVAQQLSQVGQQTMATGNFVQALAIQLPDIGIGFGAIGAAAGLLAGIALPLLMSALSGGADASRTFADAISMADDALESTANLAKIAAGDFSELTDEYGNLTAHVMDLYNADVEAGLRKLADGAKALKEELLEMYNGNAWMNVSRAEDLANGLGLGTAASREMAVAMNELALAGSLDRQIEVVSMMRRQFEEMVGPIGRMTASQFEFWSSLKDSESAMMRVKLRTTELSGAIGVADASMGKMVRTTVAAKDAVIALVANAPSGGWLSGAISDAGALAAKLWDAAAAQASLKATGSAQVGNAPPPKVGYTGGGTGAVDLGMSFGGGGGGGGGTNPIIGELETLQNSLMTQEQLQLESYTRQQETLRAALDQRLITQTEYAAMMEASELQHANQMAVIKTQEAQMVSDASRSMYGELEGFLNMFAGKSKAAAIASIALNKGLRIAEIIQNTAAAQMRAYAELGPVAGAVAAAKIGMMGKLQAGIVAASGLMQAGGAGRSGGGGAAGAGAGAVAQSSPTQTLNFTITNDPFGFGERVIRQIAEQLNQAQRNGVNIRAVVN